MRISQVFPTKYLNAADLQNQEHTLTIKSVTVEDMGEGKHKPILWFNETQKGLALNKTNSNNISVIYGDETDHWIGKQITLFGAWVDFRGESKHAIRVRPVSAAPAAPALHPGQPLQSGGQPLGSPQVAAPAAQQIGGQAPTASAALGAPANPPATDQFGTMPAQSTADELSDDIPF